MLALSVTSMVTARASPPAATMASQASLTRSVRRAASTTFAPAWASTVPKWRPKPLEAPVTRATLPVSKKGLNRSFTIGCIVRR